MASKFTYLARPESVTAGGHTPVIQRRVGNEYVTVPATAKVAPFEALRVYVTGLNILSHGVEIQVLDQSFATILTANPTSGVDGAVRYDFQGPGADGTYTVRVRETYLFSTHWVLTGFSVDSANPDPLPEPPPGGGLGSFWDQFKTVLYLGGGLVLGLAILQTLPKGRGR